VSVSIANAGIVKSKGSVQAIVIPNCVIQGNGLLNINFGTYDNPSSKTTTTKYTNNAFTVRCVKGVKVTYSAGQGLNEKHSGDSSRAMSNGETGYLSYDIYSSAGETTFFGSKNIALYTSKSTSRYSVILYVRIPPHQVIEAGTYTDSVVISIQFYPYIEARSLKAIITIVFLPQPVLTASN